jgi:hypothetical protein
VLVEAPLSNCPRDWQNTNPRPRQPCAGMFAGMRAVRVPKSSPAVVRPHALQGVLLFVTDVLDGYTRAKVLVQLGETIRDRLNRKLLKAA